MTQMRSIIGLVLLLVVVCAGCRSEKSYGTERGLSFPGRKRQVWAVAPVINLSGREPVDPILQADLVYQQLQQVNGLTVIPVNRVAEVYASLRIEQVQSAEQAELVCELLGCDALLVATVTSYDPYHPPKLGASMALFGKAGAPYARQAKVDPRELARRAAPQAGEPIASRGASFAQAVGMYDAANGSVRDAVYHYAAGRNDPKGPYGAEEYFVDMDRYCGFVYHELILDLLESTRPKRS